MAKGIIYCMTTVVPGLIKIGKTGSDNFETRMRHLERNGYCNVVGLTRHFAIEVDDYDEKEVLIHDIFSKSNVPNTELFALDIDLVVQLLSSLEGKQIYPADVSKEDMFDNATDEREIRLNSVTRYDVPDGIYYLNKKGKKASMRVEGKKFIVEKGSECFPCDNERMPEARKNAKIVNDVLQEDVICASPSTAGWVVLGNFNNGWKKWKNKDKQPIDIYRTNNENE